MTYLNVSLCCFYFARFTLILLQLAMCRRAEIDRLLSCPDFAGLSGQPASPVRHGKRPMSPYSSIKSPSSRRTVSSWTLCITQCHSIHSMHARMLSVAQISHQPGDITVALALAPRLLYWAQDSPLAGLMDQSTSVTLRWIRH